MKLTLGSPHLPETPDWVLSVDGMLPEGPNLSHWPGNRTPGEFKADLSTGICLRFARAEEGVQERFLAGATVALNDHYDTDGFLSLLCVLRPEVALAREEVVLAAAATGDFQALGSRQGFAIDRVVMQLAAAGSPVAAELAGLSAAAKDLARYRWLIDHAEAVLDETEQFSGLYQEELALVERQLEDPSILVERVPELGLALVRSAGPVHRMVLNTLAGDCFRVLHTELPGRYRYHDRTESWFEVQSFTPAPRRDMSSLVARLGQLEDSRDGAWCLDGIDEPVPELYFGAPGAQAYGQVSRVLRPSGLAPELVEGLFREFFGESS